MLITREEALAYHRDGRRVWVIEPYALIPRVGDRAVGRQPGLDGSGGK